VAQESAEGIVGRSCRSARAGHSPERGETARARTTGNERPKARTIGRVSRPRDSGVTGGRKSSSHWPSGRRVGVKPRMPIRKGPNPSWRSETPKARRAAGHTADRSTRSNRRGTDPYARWCGRGGAARLPPIPMCAEHVRQLGGVSPLHNLMEVKCQRSARASPRGGVRRKRGAKPRPDEQKPDMRQPRSDERTTDREVHIHQGPVVVDPADAR